MLALWQALPLREKERFMRHLWSLWNMHRHRISPVVAATLTDITLMAGRMVETGTDGTVTLRKRGSGEKLTIKAARVINCTGPSYRTLVRDNPLLHSLAVQKFLQTGPLGLGVASPDTPHLHVIGTPLLCERLETTAVPELREQAATIAEKITR
jgi:uncharacterized NAD(P)/FAD-binding protein YdhS